MIPDAITLPNDVTPVKSMAILSIKHQGIFAL